MSFRSKKNSRQASIIFALTLLKLLDIFYNLSGLKLLTIAAFA